MTRKTFLRDGVIALIAQVLGFFAIDAIYIGIPAWVEMPYLPFQSLFAYLAPGEYWFVGVIIGIAIGMVLYSLAVAWLLRGVRLARLRRRMS